MSVSDSKSFGHLQTLPALNVPRSYCGVGASSEKNPASAARVEDVKQMLSIGRLHLSVAIVVMAPEWPRNCFRHPLDSKLNENENIVEGEKQSSHLQLLAVRSALPVINMSPGLMLGPSPWTQSLTITTITHLVFIAQVVGRRNEHHGVNPLAVPLERPHTSALLVALPELRDIKEPGFGGLVKGGGKYEVTREQDPDVIKRRRRGRTLYLLLYPGCVPFINEQALAGCHIPPRNST